jgi:hypothetical protein
MENDASPDTLAQASSNAQLSKGLGVLGKIVASLAIQFSVWLITLPLIWFSIGGYGRPAADHASDWAMLIWILFAFFGELPMWLLFTLPAMFIVPKIQPRWSGFLIFFLVGILATFPLGAFMSKGGPGNGVVVLIICAYHAAIPVGLIWFLGKRTKQQTAA